MPEIRVALYTRRLNVRGTIFDAFAFLILPLAVFAPVARKLGKGIGDDLP